MSLSHSLIKESGQIRKTQSTIVNFLFSSLLLLRIPSVTNHASFRHPPTKQIRLLTPLCLSSLYLSRLNWPRSSISLPSFLQGKGGQPYETPRFSAAIYKKPLWTKWRGCLIVLPQGFRRRARYLAAPGISICLWLCHWFERLFLCSWDDQALNSLLHGLPDPVKDELIAQELSSNLQGLIDLVMHIDTRKQTWQKGQYQVFSLNAPVSTLASLDFLPKPMHILPKERQRCQGNYFGQAGHVVQTCLLKGQASR